MKTFKTLLALGSMMTLLLAFNHTDAQVLCRADFVASQSPGGNNIWTFSDSSTGSPGCPIISWTWDFGDGTTGTGQTVTHTYNGVGPYGVCLTITDSCGCTSTTCDTVGGTMGPNCNAFFTSNINQLNLCV